MAQSVMYDKTNNTVSLDSATMQRLGSCPRCIYCLNTEPSYLITKLSNDNGNAGRPYYRCAPCNKFITFADGRGIHLGNPECACEAPSRLQRAGRNSDQAGLLHFVCGSGMCRFYEVYKDDNGEDGYVEERYMQEYIAMGIF